MSVIPFQKPENRQKTPPLFNIPPLTLYALILILAVHIALLAMPSDMANQWGWNLAFVAARYTRPELFDIYAITSPFTHLFVHGGWMHIAMNGLMFMAFGTATERMLGGKRAAILFFVCGLAGAFTQFALNPFSPIPMVGASGALSGLFAAVILRLQQSGAVQQGRFGIWGLAAIWIGLSLAGAVIGGSFGIGNVAWAAHIGGFFAGVGLIRLAYFR